MIDKEVSCTLVGVTLKIHMVKRQDRWRTILSSGSELLVVQGSSFLLEVSSDVCITSIP